MPHVITGRVFTSDRSDADAHLWAEAVVVDDDRIAYVGDLAAAREIAGADAGVIDAGGGVVLPGFVDGHAHVLMTGDSLLKAHLRTAADLDEIGRRLLAWAEANPDQPRVVGMGWLFSSVPGGRPTRQMLDAFIADRPVYLEASDFHSSWVNTAALAELGITDDTPDPIGGRIVRDPVTGHATGHLLENASVTTVWPLLAGAVDDDARDRRLRAAIDAYVESGVTAAVDMALDRASVEAMARAEAGDTLDVRVIGHWLVHRTGDPAEELRQVDIAASMAQTHRSDRLRVIGIKLIVDGTIDGCTAALVDPYADGTNAAPIWDDESLVRVVTRADSLGLQVALHAIGDRAVRSSIDALETAARVNGTAGRRHRIEHLEYADAADVPRLGALGITASMQPVHVDPSMLPNWVAMLGDHRVERGFAWPEYLATGATLAFGTDTPTAPHLPLHNMFIAATRRSPGNLSVPPHRPDFALPLIDAVVHGTADAAWASWAEGRLGTLVPGAAADLVVLDRDPFMGDPELLLDTTVLLTMSGGRIVHDRRPS